MAGLSNMQMSQEPMIIARRKHAAVLRALNSSLQDPKTATTDATFMTVMLLGLYEVSRPRYICILIQAHYFTDDHRLYPSIPKIMGQPHQRR